MPRQFNKGFERFEKFERFERLWEGWALSRPWPTQRSALPGLKPHKRIKRIKRFKRIKPLKPIKQHRRKETDMKLKVKPTPDQMADLKKLARAMESAKEASALKRRLAPFRDDNAEALSGDGIDIDGLNVRVKVTRELIVEAA